MTRKTNTFGFGLGGGNEEDSWTTKKNISDTHLGAIFWGPLLLWKYKSKGHFLQECGRSTGLTSNILIPRFCRAELGWIVQFGPANFRKIGRRVSQQFSPANFSAFFLGLVFCRVSGPFTYAWVLFTYGWSLLLTVIWFGLLLFFQLKFGLVFLAYGGKSVWYFLLPVPLIRKSGLVLFTGGSPL